MDPNASELRSLWVPVDPTSHFPIQNLPFGVFCRPGVPRPHVGVAIGEYLLDLTVLWETGAFADTLLAKASPFEGGSLNALAQLGPIGWQTARGQVSELLRHDQGTLRDDAELCAKVLLPVADVQMQLPVCAGDYTDFYSSREHAHNVGTMLRGPDNALPPNWLHLPVAYHGRASSVVVSGTDVVRPHGQSWPEGAAAPEFGPTRLLDFELEVAAVAGRGNALGVPIAIANAEAHLFGLVLLNDWSARDIQAWEYQPLGPFLGKNFATSISPWVVTLEALAPFRCAGPTQEPAPLPYLTRPAGPSTFDLHLEVTLQGTGMPSPVRVCASNFRHLYWSLAQQVAHHTVNGCPLRAGDLLGSGTISGPEPASFGSLLELSWRGTRPLDLGGEERRTFLHDGDRVTLTGWCQGHGYRVGLGEVTGTVLPAPG